MRLAVLTAVRMAISSFRSEDDTAVSLQRL
jgi:hypothetical protein